VRQLEDLLRRVNSWAAIAVLALIGWLIDSLIWFLETHPLTGAGLLSYLSHSWYALPLLVAIVIILRLRRPSELLSLTIYDERGVPIHRQGDFRLEESVLEPILLSFQGTAQGAGLHRIDLPSGLVVYFLRQGALTLVTCFSGPPRPAHLEEGLRLLRQGQPPTEDLLRDLPPDVAALTANLLNAPVERDLLTYLSSHRMVAMTATDLAGNVGHGEGDVTSALQNLEQLTLVYRQCVCDITFFRLTDDRTWLARLDQFIDWRVGWLARARRVEQLVGPGVFDDRRDSSRPNLLNNA
jgi:hypothetical protein